MTTTTTTNTADLILEITGQIKVLRLALAHLSDTGAIDFAFIEHIYAIEDKLKKAYEIEEG